MKSNNFDPLEYIESAFLDSKKSGPDHREPLDDGNDTNIPSITDYIKGRVADSSNEESRPTQRSRARFKKTVMSAPRPRRSKGTAEAPIDPELQNVWMTLPKNVEFLCSFYDDNVTANYYRGEFKESRQDLIKRLLDPELSLEETSRLLGVCPATVRRYTNREWLHHHRTAGGQRRFRLSNIVKFVEDHGRFPKE